MKYFYEQEHARHNSLKQDIEENYIPKREHHALIERTRGNKAHFLEAMLTQLDELMSGSENESDKLRKGILKLRDPYDTEVGVL